MATAVHLILFILLPLVVTARICHNINVRNSVSNLTDLEGCTVVEGYVQIVLIELANETDFEPWSFPLLREITQYLLFYRVKGLRRIGQLFPNLTKIGGSSLFIDYGLVVHEMFSLQEIGLSNLKEITRGSVIVTKNPSLCYVNTINWELIAKWDPMKNYVAKNRDPRDCPGCPGDCPQGLCWSRTDCQIQPEPLDCHPLCVWGCSGPGPHQCHSCRRFLTADNECVQNCPPDTYEYLNRRCITGEDCAATDLPKETSSGLRFHSPSGRGTKYIIFNGTCTDTCPLGHEFTSTGSGCKPCRDGKCQKWCSGMNIENIADAQRLRGCTHIEGSLEISIRTGKPKNVLEELEENLGSIEEIECYLKIVRSFPVKNLNFLRNLTIIHGKTSDTGFGDNYSLLVLENKNLQELWDWDTKPNFTISKGQVFFHNNPKLCLQVIYKLLTVIHRDTNVSNLEVGKDSNGDKFPCNATEIFINVTFKSFDTIQLNVPYLHIDYDTTDLRYVIYFTKSANRNITMFDDFDQCSDYGWRTKDISVDPHDLFFERHGFLVNLTGLEPITQYAFYVTTYTVDRFGAKSAIYYETTLPTTPSELTQVVASSNQSNKISLVWEPPQHVNGEMKEYIVTWSVLELDRTRISMRNYCEYPMTYISESESFRPDIKKTEDLPKSCCKDPKPRVHIPKDGFEHLCSNFDYCHLIGETEKDSTMTCESCFYSYVYDHPLQFNNSAANPKYHNKVYGKSIEGQNYSANLTDSEVITAYIPGNSSGFTISDVKHFTEYLVTIRACREPYPGEPDKTEDNLCSKTDILTIRTQKYREADRITSRITNEILNGTVFIMWETPDNPNGMVVAFEVEYRNRNSDNINPITSCITYSEYISQNGRFSIVGLAPGSYEVRVRAITLAGKGEFTDYFYFKISNGTFSVFHILFAAILLCIIIILASIVLTIYQKKRTLETLVAIVNPDYQNYVHDHWEIPEEDVELVQELGSGSFGKVFEGLIKSSNTPCAVKTVSEDSTSYDTNLFLSEASVMKSVTGAYHIVHLLGVVSKVRPPLVIMELMSLGDLKTYLRNIREAQPPSNATMIRMALQIGDGMAFMEAKKFVHRDLAARNCMVNQELIVKVGDFGMTRDIYETDYYRKNNTGLLPIRWMSPESLKDGVFTSQSDVWSFGVVLWEIITLAEQPYQGSSNDQVLQEVIAGRKLFVPKESPDVLKTVMVACWRRKPSQRMTFTQIVSTLVYYHDDEFKKVAYYYSKKAMDLRKTSNDYVEMRSVEDPLLGGVQRPPESPKAGNVSVLLSKVKSFGRNERLSRIDEAGPSYEERA